MPENNLIVDLFCKKSKITHKKLKIILWAVNYY